MIFSNKFIRLNEHYSNFYDHVPAPMFDYGYADLAYKMIVRRDSPSYGHYVEIGATTLRDDTQTSKTFVFRKCQ